MRKNLRLFSPTHDEADLRKTSRRTTTGILRLKETPWKCGSDMNLRGAMHSARRRVLRRLHSSGNRCAWRVRKLFKNNIAYRVGSDRREIRPKQSNSSRNKCFTTTPMESPIGWNRRDGRVDAVSNGRLRV